MGGQSITTDIAILGGGLAGLLIAVELAAHSSVVVVDKQPRRGKAFKYWVTPSTIDAPYFADLIDQRFTTMDFISHCGDIRRVKGDYALWDGDGIISRLQRRAEVLGCEFLNKHHFYSFRRTDGKIVAMCEGREIVCSLVVDCMGAGSPLTQALSVIDIRGYYAVIGAELTANDEVKPVCLHNVTIGSNARYLEIFPRSNGQVYAALIAPITNLGLRADVSKEFDFILSHTSYKNILNKQNRKRGLLGIVPVGNLRRQAVDNIYFFGEAGQIHPAATGACLTVMLDALKPIAAGLTRCVKEQTVTARDLRRIRGGMTDFNAKFQLALYDEILSWSSPDFRRVLLKMKTIDDELINDMLFGRIDLKSKMTAKNIVRIIRTSNWPLIRSFVRAALKVS
jgi:flavin-dependent dehydrogenase